MKYRLIGKAALVLLLVSGTARLFAREARYVFLFIGDGMGFAQVQAAGLARASQGAGELCFTGFPVQGFVTTHSASNDVTDSAAAGTALAAGEKTANGVLGLDAACKVPLVSVAERAKRAGCRVGVATSVAVNHATPAAFYAHRSAREGYYDIGLDALRAGFDIYAGAGFKEERRKGDPESPNLYDLFAGAGYRIVRGAGDFAAAADGAERVVFVQPDDAANPSSLPPAADRRAGDMTLEEITAGCIGFLARGKDGGRPPRFFLMVEGGIIDWLCHANDTAAALAETCDLERSVALALAFYRRYPDETLIVVTADHETGGLAVGRGETAPVSFDAAVRQTASVIGVTLRLKALRDARPGEMVPWDDVREVLRAGYGFWDGTQLTADEEALLKASYEESFRMQEGSLVRSLYYAVEPVADCAVKIVARRTGVVWGSGAHTAAAVPVYVLGAGAERFSALRDNTDIPRAIARAAGYPDAD
mgnify:CR=1 FL=1